MIDIKKSINNYINILYNIIPVNKDAKIVPKTGVLNLEFTEPRKLNINPSDAMAYKIRGNGNIDPNKLKNVF